MTRLETWHLDPNDFRTACGQVAVRVDEMYKVIGQLEGEMTELLRCLRARRDENPHTGDSPCGTGLSRAEVFEMVFETYTYIGTGERIFTGDFARGNMGHGNKEGTKHDSTL